MLGDCCMHLTGSTALSILGTEHAEEFTRFKQKQPVPVPNRRLLMIRGRWRRLKCSVDSGHALLGDASPPAATQVPQI